LRISVQPGGCSGLRYQLYFTNQYSKVLAKDLTERLDEGFSEPDDDETAAQRAALEREAETLVWSEWFAIVIDRKSGPFLDNATIDYVDTIPEQSFKIDNPNAQASCACGEAFH